MSQPPSASTDLVRCTVQLVCRAKKEEDYDKRFITEGSKRGQYKALMKVLRQSQELYDIMDQIFGGCASSEPMQTRDLGKAWCKAVNELIAG